MLVMIKKTVAAPPPSADEATALIRAGSIQARDVIIQFGLMGTPQSFRVRVRKLLDYYLGSKESPVPFGGRDQEIAKLNAWLTDASASRNLLITAPAGRGKTALLVRWIDQLPSDLGTAFIPISIRYDTNRSAVFYQALAQRLAEIRDEKLPATPTDPSEFYKERVLEYMDRFNDPDRPCLIVIDGLDEATGWQVDASVVPAHPPQGLRIVVSARQLAGDKGSADWLDRLGWAKPHGDAESFEVPRLTREGVADVLAKMGNPLAPLSHEIDIIGELYRLTEGGDPLLLELYVNDLLGEPGKVARLSPRNLAAEPPGFGPYFKSWFSYQRKAWQDAGRVVDEARLNVVLAILGCALGPLSLADIGQLVDEVAPGGQFITPDTISPIDRFVIGDGIETGFSLSHPKLADYIQQHHFGGSDIIEKVRGGFLRWGEGTVRSLNTGMAQPDKASRYLLLYYIQHLQAVHPAPLERFRELAETGWRRAWQHLEGGDRELSEQLEICFDALLDTARSNPAALKCTGTGLGGIIHIGLCLSSIRSIGTSVPTNFLGEMVRQGLISPRHALFISRFQSDYQRAVLIKILVPFLDQTLLAEAEAEARQIDDPTQRVETLLAVAQRLPSPQQLDLIKAIIIGAGGRIAVRHQLIGSADSLEGTPDDTVRINLIRTVVEAAVRTRTEGGGCGRRYGRTLYASR